MLQPRVSDIERRMLTRDSKIQEVKENMNSVEDRVFSEFCSRLGVKNIRQYEERELVMQQERARKRAEFDQQIDTISNRLDFERQKDTKSKLINIQTFFHYPVSFSKETSIVGSVRYKMKKML